MVQAPPVANIAVHTEATRPMFGYIAASSSSLLPFLCLHFAVVGYDSSPWFDPIDQSFASAVLSLRS